MTAKLSDLEKRLVELESRIVFQDDLIESLNEVIARHDREIITMTDQLKALFSRMSDLADTAAPGASAEDEIPPHY